MTAAPRGRVVIGSVWLYRRLLTLYPPTFRQHHGRELAQVFRAACGDAERQAGALGVLRLWPAALWDLVATALAERLADAARGAGPRPAGGARVERLAAAMAGLLGLAVFAWGVENQLARGGPAALFAPDTWFWWLFIGGVILVMVGAHHHAARRRRWGRPLLALGCLACLPTAVFAGQIGSLGLRWGRTGIVAGGTTLEGGPWPVQWLVMATAILGVLALALVSLVAARDARRALPADGPGRGWPMTRDGAEPAPVTARRRRARRGVRRGAALAALVVALGLGVAALPQGGAGAQDVRARLALALLRREVGYPLYLPTALPARTRLTAATSAPSRSEGVVATLQYRVPTPAGDIGLIVHQSRPEHAFRLVIPPEQVLARPQIGAHEGLLYSAGGPPSGPPLLILAWSDGAYHLEVWGALPTAELVTVARSLRRED